MEKAKEDYEQEAYESPEEKENANSEEEEEEVTSFVGRNGKKKYGDDGDFIPHVAVSSDNTFIRFARFFG